MRQAPFGRLLSPNRPHTPCLHAHRIAEWRAEAPRRPVRRAPTLAPPVPSQVLSLSRLDGRLLSLWLCTRPTAGTAPQVCGDAPRTGRAPLGWPNCTHAYDSAACHLSCLGMGGVAQFVKYLCRMGRAWEAGGRRARSQGPLSWADQWTKSNPKSVVRWIAPSTHNTDEISSSSPQHWNCLRTLHSSTAELRLPTIDENRVV